MFNVIRDRVLEGKVALMLGSGASVGASLPEDRNILLGNDLRDLLSDSFLGGDFKDGDLKFVADLAISSYSLFDVQDFIRDYFIGIEPAQFHLKIPDYKWRAIFTTNYDRLIETCYERNTNRTQKVELILSNNDRFDQTRLNSSLLPLIKLHGCVTRTHDDDLPLILTVDQYNDSLIQKRDRLFKLLYDLAYENTLVFVGHSLLDHNLRAVLNELKKEVSHGQRHYLLKPGVSEMEANFWGEQKVTALDATFEDFINYLEKSISTKERLLSTVRPPKDHAVQEVFTEKVAPSEELTRLLESEVEYISSSTQLSAENPQDFYKGVDQGWYPIVEKLAVKRGLENKIFSDVLDVMDTERDLVTELVLIKAEAGSGKTVLLRQLAWRGASSKLGVFLWVKQSGSLDSSLIEELCVKTSGRVFIFWDNAANNVRELTRFIIDVRKKKLAVTVVTSERFNEWNMRCPDLDQYVSSIHKLGYLSEREIEELLEKLRTHDSLGPNLQSKSLAEQKEALTKRHGRQLLVALHEATMGETFEDIVFDEYTNHEPEAAKKIDLTICSLNRLRVPVRAGLISRIHDITFEQFANRFYKPLEKVVFSTSRSDADTSYMARHPEVAEIVFRRVLNTPELRYLEYIRILSKLNISYKSDHTSFRNMIKARSLRELFPTHDDVKRIYDYSVKTFGEDAYLLQQMAIYERVRENGNLKKAVKILEKASELAPYDRSILHSLSTVWRDRARAESDSNLRARYRRNARAHLEKSTKQFGESSYDMATLIELSIQDLEDLLSDSNSTQEVIDDAVRRVQVKIAEHKQKYPSESHYYTLELKLAELLDNNMSITSALESSFEARDREPFIAIRLSSVYRKRGEVDNAIEVLQKALDRRGTNHELNYHLASLLKLDETTDIDRLIYHFRRAFTPGDRNYQAQFWFARYACRSSDPKLKKEAEEVFVTLRSARLPHAQRVKVVDIEGGRENPKNYEGTVVRKRMGYGFVKVDGSGEELFCPSNSMKDDLWDAVNESDRLKLNIGYTLKGPICVNVKPF